MAYQFSKRHRTTFQILGVILLLLFFSAVLVPLLGASIISILTVGAIIIIIAVIVGNVASEQRGRDLRHGFYGAPSRRPLSASPVVPTFPIADPQPIPEGRSLLLAD